MSTNDDWAYRSASDAVASLAAREVSSREMVDAAIARIEATDGAINAVVVRDFERARADADRADAALAAGERRPLLGLPMTIKESIDVAGLPKTWGNPAFRDFRAEADGLAVERLREAGAVIVGKTNVPFMLADWQAFNEIYGTTNNPYDVRLTPGGSSGGSSAALAAGFVPLELGSDMNGSLRVPAHCCGVFAHRPSLDVIPMRGGAAPGMTPTPGLGGFATLGPLARTVRDLRLAFDVLAGPDPLTEGRGYRLVLPPPRADTLAGFRVLLLDTHPLVPTSAEVGDALASLAGDLARAGCQLSRARSLLPSLEKVAALFMTYLAANFQGHRSAEDLRRFTAAKAALAPDDEGFRSSFLRGFGLTYRELMQLNRTRQELQAQFRALFAEVDLIVCPVLPIAAFPHDHGGFDRTIDIDGARLPYHLQGVWCSIASLLGVPVTVAPIARTEAGLPIGAQIIGSYLDDNSTLTFAALLERERGGFVPPVRQP